MALNLVNTIVKFLQLNPQQNLPPARLSTGYLRHIRMNGGTNKNDHSIIPARVAKSGSILTLSP